MSRSFTRARALRAATAAAALAGLVGCSVAIIDVDVYKGPLADHERVQVEQMAAMAVAAKPLLIRLRNKLAIAELAKDSQYKDQVKYNDPPTVAEAAAEKAFLANSRYRDGFVCVDRENTYLRTERAKFVNAVLYLYLDRRAAERQCPPEVTKLSPVDSELADQTVRAFRNFERGWREYLGQGTSKTTWEDLRTRLCGKPSPSATCQLSANTALGQILGSEVRGADVSAFAYAYDRFLSDWGSDSKRPIAVINEYLDLVAARAETRDTAKAVTAELLRGVESSLLVAPQERGTRLVAEEPAEAAAIDALRRLARNHAALLFANPEDQSRFADLIASRADNYVQAREALADVFDRSLRRLHAMPAQPQTLRGKEVRDVLIRLVVALADRSKVAAVAGAVKGNSRFPEENAEFKDLLQLAAQLFQHEASTNKENIPLKDYIEFLRKGLADSRSAHFVRGMMRADDIIRTLTPEDLRNDPRTFLKADLTSSGRRFGLTRVPERNEFQQLMANSAIAPNGLSNAAASLAGAGGDIVSVIGQTIEASLISVALAGLDAGRLEHGLETLIEDYLKAVDGSPDRRFESGERELRRLQNALVNFSQKLLFVANHERLLDGSADETLRKSVLVLQAVGNSLRIQADELAQRLEHGEKLSKFAAENEVAGVRRALTRFGTDTQGNSGGAAYIQSVLDKFNQSAGNAGRAQKNSNDEKTAAEKLAGDTLATYRTALGLAETAIPDLNADPLQASASDKGLNVEKKKLDDAEARLNAAFNARRGPLDAHAAIAGSTSEAEPGYTTGGGDAGILKLAAEPRVRAALAPPADGSVPKPGGETLQALSTALASQPWVLAGTPRHAVFTSAKAYLDDTAVAAALVADLDKDIAAEPDPKKVSVDRLFTLLGKRLADRATEVRQHPTVVDAQKKAAAAEKAFATEQARFNGLRGEAVRTARRATETKAAAQKSADVASDYTNAATRLRTVFNDLAPDLAGVSPAVAHRTVLARLRADHRAALARSAKEDADALEDAIAQIAVETPPISVDPETKTPYRALSDEQLLGDPRDNPYRSLAARRENAKDVLDRMIAALREEHLQAVREGGAQSPHAQQIAQAIETAYTHRAGMAYLRPASAYLRSSYTATSLQDNSLGWQNRLTAMGRRSVPLLGSDLEDYIDKDRKTIDEIDKQFWQNINRVQVTGSGRTNYVLAKDDVGNWYVRGYSSSPEDIIRSASGLAKFNFGAKLNTNLLTPDGRPAPQRTEMERLFERHRQAFYDATAAQYTALTAEIAAAPTAGSVGQRTANRVTGAAPDATDQQALRDAVGRAAAVLERAHAEMTQSLPIDPADAARTRGSRIVGALRTLQAFDQAVAAEIDALNLASQVKADAKRRAAAVVLESLDRHVGERATRVNEFDTAITFIGDAVREASATPLAR